MLRRRGPGGRWAALFIVLTFRCRNQATEQKQSEGITNKVSAVSNNTHRELLANRTVVW